MSKERADTEAGHVSHGLQGRSGRFRKLISPSRFKTFLLLPTDTYHVALIVSRHDNSALHRINSGAHWPSTRDQTGPQPHPRPRCHRTGNLALTNLRHRDRTTPSTNVATTLRKLAQRRLTQDRSVSPPAWSLRHCPVVTTAPSSPMPHARPARPRHSDGHADLRGHPPDEATKPFRGHFSRVNARCC